MAKRKLALQAFDSTPPSEPANWIEQMPRSVAAISMRPSGGVGASIANSGSDGRRGDICRASFKLRCGFSRTMPVSTGAVTRVIHGASHIVAGLQIALELAQPAGIGVLARGDSQRRLKRLADGTGLPKRLAEPLERDRLIEMLFDVAAESLSQNRIVRGR